MHSHKNIARVQAETTIGYLKSALSQIWIVRWRKRSKCIQITCCCVRLETAKMDMKLVHIDSYRSIYMEWGICVQKNTEWVHPAISGLDPILHFGLSLLYLYDVQSSRWTSSSVLWSFVSNEMVLYRSILQIRLSWSVLWQWGWC